MRPRSKRSSAKQFFEVVIAPEIEAGAMEVAKRRKNVRVLACGPLVNRSRGYDLKRVGGGLLVQTADETCLDDGALKVVTRRAPTALEMTDLLFAWKVAWFVKSNAIVYAKGRRNDRRGCRPDESCRQRANRGIEGRR